LLCSLHHSCTRQNRIVIAYFSHLSDPALNFSELIGLRMRQPPQNVLSPANVSDLVALADFETVKTEVRLLSPFRMLGIGRLVNRFLASLPLIRNLCLRHYSVCRSLRHLDRTVGSATIVIPTRNERDNIEAAVRRIPRFTDDLEIIFVEGHSK